MRRNMPGGMNPALGMSSQLSDLDRELELLRRKREMYEQKQHQLLDHEPFGGQSRQMRPFEHPAQMYNQPSYSAQSINQSYSHLYDNPSNSQSGNFAQNYGQKRKADWKSNQSNKRFYNPQSKPNRPGNWATNQRRDTKGSDPLSSRSLQLLSRPEPFTNRSGDFMNNQPTLPSLLRFEPPARFRNPNKVTKAKAAAKFRAPHQINSYPTEQRKNLITQTATTFDDEIVLRADRVPSKQMTGRLELALGHFLKELKNKYVSPPYSTLFNTHRRLIKQTIRERLRSAMLNHPVGSTKDITNIYRQKFSVKSDKDILKVALAAENKKEKANRHVNTYLDSVTDTAEKYFKDNMEKLLENRLTEMFSKLRNLYHEENTYIDTTMANMEEGDENYEEPKEDSDLMENSDLKPDETSGSKPDETSGSKPDETSNLKPDENSESMPVEDSQSKPHEQVNTEIDISSENEATNQNDVIVNEEVSNAKSDIKSENSIDLTKTEDNPPNEQDKKTMQQRVEEMVDIYLDRKLPEVLPKFRLHIMKILNVDRMFKGVRSMIISKARSDVFKGRMIIPEDAVANAGHNKQPANDSKAKIDEAVAKKQLPRQKNIPRQENIPILYYVKVIGRPYLPKKKQMQEFLYQFNPLSIKKHKSVHNLLFIGLGNMEDYHNILAATSTHIGNNRILVKVNESKNTNENGDSKTDADDDIIMIENTEKKNSSAESLDDDLDGQITDLLSSIRKAEEEENDKGVEKEPEEIKETQNTVTEENAEVQENEGDKDSVEIIEEPQANLTEENTDINGDEGKSCVEAIEEPQKEVEDDATKNEDDKTNKEDETSKNVEESVDNDKVEKGDNDKVKKGDNDNVEKVDNDKVEKVDNDKVEKVVNDGKDIGKATPTRASTRIANATPSSIRTRRASKLAQNN